MFSVQYVMKEEEKCIERLFVLPVFENMGR
jgi:hypothetical protein